MVTEPVKVFWYKGIY